MDETVDDSYLTELAIAEIIKQARRITNYNDWIKYKRKLAQAITQYDKVNTNENI